MTVESNNGVTQAQAEAVVAEVAQRVPQSSLTRELKDYTFQDWMEIAGNCDYEPGWALRRWILNFAQHHKPTQDDVEEVAKLFGCESYYIWKRVGQGY
jgi:hypothetical protein